MYKLMIVDDEDIVRRSLIRNIQWSEYNFQVVAQAASAKEAIEQLSTFTPDLLMTDIKMPDMTGLELIAYCKQQLPELATVILSAYDDFLYAQDAIHYGVSGYLLKPIEKDALDEFMKKTLQQLQKREMEQRIVKEKYECSADASDDIVQRAKNIVMENFENKITLEMVAKKCFTNSTYLSNIFKMRMGCNFVDYVNELKIQKAKQMLQFSTYKVKDIAIKVGFDDYTYFCKVFKKNTGETPLHYRCKTKQ